MISPPGGYRFGSSNAARITLQTLKESLETELAEYLKNNKKVTIKIKGSTDATPIASKINYLGEYGNFIDEPYYLNNNFEVVNITPETGITTNEQLAFLRIQGVKNFIENYIDPLKSTKNSFQYYAEVAKDRGSQYRRISVEVVIHKAFDGVNKDKQTLADVDKNIPKTNKVNAHTYALIIGNEDYSSMQTGMSTQANVDFAVHDAEVFSQYVINTLGVPERQVKVIKNATANQMKQALNWLNTLTRYEEGRAKIIFYYSGHGLPEENTKEPYLIPVDVSGLNLASALKLQEVYDSLMRYPSEKATVFLDACFSGGGRNQGLIERKAVRVAPKENIITGNLIVFSSSSGDQSSGVYKEKFHGYFTYFLLKKLQDSQGNITYGELSNYLLNNLAKETALEGKIQTPTIKTSYDIKQNWNIWKVNE